MRQACIWMFCWLCLGVGVSVVAAAEEEGANLTQSAGFGGVGFYRPNYWGIVNVHIANRSSTDSEVEIINVFPADRQIQFGIKAWIPAMSLRRLSIPVHVPEHLVEQPSVPGLAVETIQVRKGASGEVRTRAEPGLLRLETQTHVTMAMLQDAEVDGPSRLAASARTVFPGRPNRRIIYVASKDFPYFAAALDVLDVIAISAATPTLDDLQVQALRSWLLGGGRLWIMADRVSPGFMARLLQDDWTAQEVGRTTLNSVHIHGLGGTPEPRFFEEPADFVRLSAADWQVLQTHQGWPVALGKQVGHGQVMLTTMSHTGLVQVDDSPTPPLEELARWFLHPKESSPLTAGTMKPYLNAQIGYSVVSRHVVAMVLTLFIVSLAASAVMLRRRDRPQWSVVSGVALALGAAGVLLVIGVAKRQGVQLTQASAQFVRVAPSQDLALISGSMSLYSPRDGEGGLWSVGGGLGWPEMSGQSGEVRMMWTDTDKWEYEGLRPAGGTVKFAAFDAAAKVHARTQVTCRLTEAGLEGVVENPPGLDAGVPFEDAVVTSPQGLMPVAIDRGLKFRIDSGVPRLTGKFLLGNLDLQTRRARQEIYERIAFAKSQANRSDDSRSLYLWGSALRSPVEMVKDGIRRDSALYEFPLQIEPVAPGTKVHIPPMMITVDEVRGLSNVVINSPGSPPGTKLTQTMAGVTTFRFQVPREAMPLDIESGKLHLTLEAPERKVEISLPRPDEPPKLVAVMPGEQTLDLSSIGNPVVTTDGGLIVRFKVGEPPTFDPGRPPIWSIRQIALELTGTVRK